MFWKRPAFWTGLIAVVAYWDSRALNGNWVYDDAGSVLKNVVVNGQVPWREAFVRDYWGIEMKTAQSHKSFRPLTTLSLKLNYMIGDKYFEKGPDGKYPQTLGFHLVNIFLHGTVTGMVTEASKYVFPKQMALQVIVGCLFGLHPVHAEVVSNITSRGELLMSCFMLWAFLSYARCIRQQEFLKNSRLQWIWGVYIVPWLGMTASLFSKEQGATTLITLVFWDFLEHYGSLQVLFGKLKSKDTQALQFTGRTVILAVQTLVVVFWRYLLNGETSPDFIEAQNPAGFSADRLTRAFSIPWIYCLYIRDAVWPYRLSPDWSGISIDLITKISDPRAILVMALWYASFSSFWSMVIPPKETTNAAGTGMDDWTIRRLNMAVWPFCFSPFLLSSNLLVVPGLMKADRVIYLPLFGFCIFEAALLGMLIKDRIRMTLKLQTQRQRKFWLAYFVVIFQLTIFCSLTHQRNLAWSDSLKLWEAAYHINPRSHHTMYNFGYELSIKQRYEEAEYVMRPIGSARVEGPSNTFVYTMVLYNLQRCPEANDLLDEAFEVIEEKKREGGPRNQPGQLARTESNLLVSRAHCTENIKERARILYQAVEVDQSNEYAIQIATSVMERLQQLESMGLN